MNGSRSKREINQRCKYLESLGFTISHQDSSVLLNGMEFDFSATGMNTDSILRTVIKKSKAKGYAEGVNSVQEQMRKAMGISDLV
jgi:hypothetical protein